MVAHILIALGLVGPPGPPAPVCTLAATGRSALVGHHSTGLHGRRATPADCRRALRERVSLRLPEPRVRTRSTVHLTHGRRAARGLRCTCRASHRESGRVPTVTGVLAVRPNTVRTPPRQGTMPSLSWTIPRSKSWRGYLDRGSRTGSRMLPPSGGLRPGRVGAAGLCDRCDDQHCGGADRARRRGGQHQYDAGSHCVIVAIQTANQLAVIDPATATIVRRITLDPAVRYPHGFSIDAPHVWRSSPVRRVGR